MMSGRFHTLVPDQASWGSLCTVHVGNKVNPIREAVFNVTSASQPSFIVYILREFTIVEVIAFVNG
jgi:hypothetical protein